VITPRICALLIAASAACVVLSPLRVHAQWWSARAPADFEECADAAEKAATKEDKTFQLSECHSKFAGRRKPGGGYTYFDFMQNRNFDIAGPNPTPEEQKQIDEQYTAFLDGERQRTIAAALMAKQQQVQQASLKQSPLGNEKVPVPVEAPNKSQAGAIDIRSHIKSGNCVRHSFSCDWPRLSEGLKDLKKLFSSPSNKAKRS
jgi:septum formation inhibitor MinC